MRYLYAFDWRFFCWGLRVDWAQIPLFIFFSLQFGAGFRLLRYNPGRFSWNIFPHCCSLYFFFSIAVKFYIGDIRAAFFFCLFFSFSPVDPCGICESNSLSCVTRSPTMLYTVRCVYIHHVQPEAKGCDGRGKSKDISELRMYYSKYVYILSREPSRYLCWRGNVHPRRMQSKSLLLLCSNENGYPPTR